MSGAFGGLRLVSFPAILFGVIAFSMPSLAAAAAPEKSTPAPAAVSAPVSAVPNSAPAPTAVTAPVSPAPNSALVPASVTPASTAPVAPRLPTLLEQLDLMGSPALDRSSLGLRVITSAGGMRQIHLEGRFRDYVVATRGADGRIRLDCLPGLAAVRRYFEIPVAARSPRATEE